MAEETEQGVGLLGGQTLVFQNGGQVAQVLQRQQHERVDVFGLQLTVLLHPLCCKTHLFVVVSHIIAAESAVFQLRHKLVELLSRVPLFISLVIDDGYLHFVIGVLVSAKIQNSFHICKFLR